MRSFTSAIPDIIRGNSCSGSKVHPMRAARSCLLNISPSPGGGSVCFAIFAWIWLPKSPSTWKRLTERQKAIANARILADSSVVVNEKLNIRDSFRPFADPMYWYGPIYTLSDHGMTIDAGCGP